MTETAKNNKTRLNKTFGSKRRLIIYLTIILTLLIICVIPHGRENFQRCVMSLLPVPSPTIVQLSGTPQEMGKSHGK